jgi:hypothetical protein
MHRKCSITPAQAPNPTARAFSMSGIAPDPVATQNGLWEQAGNSQYPAIHGALPEVSLDRRSLSQQ